MLGGCIFLKVSPLQGRHSKMSTKPDCVATDIAVRKLVRSQEMLKLL